MVKQKSVSYETRYLNQRSNKTVRVKQRSVSRSYHSIAIQLILPDAKFVLQRTPGTICLQLPTESYLWMRTGRTPAAEWDARKSPAENAGKYAGELPWPPPCRST